ncbi:hypothetical protein AWM70_00630 [Paenibacillus yonginensis]|uniref:Uncharacterized protein n=1 Tax=Paenibacillus yonginensis TaxID=1462996 RepID=A0A1B1MVR7_9BACL|nr:hypothetical protein AWM70_00630 [Paenibacillus yonginensis]
MILEKRERPHKSFPKESCLGSIGGLPDFILLNLVKEIREEQRSEEHSTSQRPHCSGNLAAASSESPA